jgi:hypothetical protein
MTGTAGRLSAGFRSGFLCGFWFRVLVGLIIFFETFFDLVLLVRVFFFAMVFTGLSRKGKLAPLDSIVIGVFDY